jgi:4'-phosphopantetheinyl transferase EntD
MFKLFKHHNRGALAHDETVAVTVIGPRRLFRGVVADVESALQAAKPASRSG